MKKFIAAAFISLLMCTHAYAHHHHRHHHHRSHHVQKSISGNVGGVSVRFVHGHLICAVNVSRWLSAHGFKSPNSRSSRAFLRYAHIAAASAHYGDVRFNYRRGGGHVQVVLGWQGGGLWCLNPSERHQGWVRRECKAGGIFLRT